MKKNSNEIRKPKIYLYFGIPSLILWVVLFIWCFFEKEDLEYESPIVPFILCGPFVLCFLYVCLLSINWKIIVEKDKIIIINFLRMKRVYNRDEISVFYKNPDKKGTPKFYLYQGEKRRATISMYDDGFDIITELNQDLSKFI